MRLQESLTHAERFAATNLPDFVPTEDAADGKRTVIPDCRH